MLFKEIVGQNDLKQHLIANIDEGRVAHSQLFIGDSGFGALALAIAYGQYLNCSDRKDGDSCGVCPSCYKYQHLQHPDLHFIYPINKSQHAIGSGSDGIVVSRNLLHKWVEIYNDSIPKGYFTPQEWYNHIEISKNAQGIISKSEANALIEKLNFKSFEGGYKVVIIWLAEEMNDASANALLKLFEEPTEKTLFLFVTHNKNKIIKTILSRTQHTFITPVSKVDIYQQLLTSGYDNNIAEVAANLSEGSVITAYSVAQKIKSGETDPNFDYFTKLMRLCFAINHLELMDWATELSTLRKEDIQHFLTYSVNILRSSFISNIGMESIVFNYPYEKDFIAKFKPFVHFNNIEQLLFEFEKCGAELAQNVNSKIVITHFTLAISKLIKKP